MVPRLSYALVSMFLVGGAGGQAAPPRHWPAERFVRWQPEWGAGTIAAEGISASIERRACGDRRPVSEACWKGDAYLVATVSAPGVAPVTIEGGAGVGWFFGIGRMGGHARRSSLVLVTENGGTDDCARIDMAVPEGGAFHHVRVSVDARDRGTVCGVPFGTLAWPRDLTGHGRAEMILSDMRLHCRFSSCAGSWHPPRVVAFDGPRGIDVSDDPALTRTYRRDMVQARRACEHRVEEAQGACAGYAFDAARVGRLAQAWRVIAAQVRRGCRIRSAGTCPDTNRVSPQFPVQLAAALHSTCRIGWQCSARPDLGLVIQRVPAGNR